MQSFQQCRLSTTQNNNRLKIEHTYAIQTNFPHDNSKQPDILDIAITNTSTVYHSTPVFEMDTDHLPVLITTKIIPPPHAPTQKLITQNINWETFRKIVRAKTPQFKILNSPMEIENSVMQLNEIITNTIKHLQENKPTYSFKQTKPKLPKEIIEIINTRNKTRKLRSKNRIPQLKKELNLLNEITKRAINTHTQKSFDSKIETLNTSNKSLWHFSKCLLNKKITMPPLNTTQGIKYAPQDKAEALAEHFAQTFKPNNTPVHLDHQAIIDSNGAPNYDVPQRLKFISPTEVKNLIKKLPKRKTPGHDLISNQILKNLPTITIAYINNIYNSSFRLGYFPRTWKISNIIPIPKPSKNHSLAVNYRPISLLPTLSKLFENMILKRLNNHLTKSEAIPNHQFGFRNHISTDQLLRITEYIHTAFQEKKHTIVTLLDVSQAFDRVWHPGLIYKLKTIGTPKYLQNIITQLCQTDPS